MTWTQKQDANMTVGYVGGWCLKYVQDAFATDHPYPTAMAAWNANYGGGNHPNEEPPLGITVPVYFALGSVSAGHVAIRLDDGWVASSTMPGEHSAPYYHRNLADLIAVYGKYNGGCTYLGWSEFVGTVRVVQDVEPPAAIIAATQPPPEPVVSEVHNPTPDPTPVPAPVPAPVIPEAATTTTTTTTIQPVQITKENTIVQNIVNQLKIHAPIVLAVLLVLVNALIDSGFVSLPQNLVDTINVVLAAGGLTVLHVRQNKG